MRAGLPLLSLLLPSCAVESPPEPRELDCETLDRAAERFPEACGEAEQADNADAALGERGDAAIDARDDAE
jgi:hypothetical protein